MDMSLGGLPEGTQACGCQYVFLRGREDDVDKQADDEVDALAVPTGHNQNGMQLLTLMQTHTGAGLVSEKLELGLELSTSKNTRAEGGDKVPAVWTQGSRQVCLSRCPKS